MTIAGDTLPDLTGSTGTDLTGATSVTVHVVMPDGTLLTRAAVVATGTTGAWSMPWQIGDLAPGVYQHEIEVIDTGGTRTFPGVAFRVAPQLDQGQPPFVPPLTVVDNGDGTGTITWS